VRESTGKPVVFTVADCESEARRIQRTGNDYATDFSRAAESKVFRTQSDLLSGDLAIAARSCLCSSGESRALTMMARRFAFGTFGLPVFGLIDTLRKTKIIVDAAWIAFYSRSRIKTVWRKTEFFDGAPGRAARHPRHIHGFWRPEVSAASRFNRGAGAESAPHISPG
jgi:hypothetical protein